MRMWMVVVMFVGACSTQGVDRARRWPHHRQQGDARFAALEKRNAELEQQNVALAGRVAKLEAWVARAQVKTTATTTPDAAAPPAPAPP